MCKKCEEWCPCSPYVITGQFNRYKLRYSDRKRRMCRACSEYKVHLCTCNIYDNEIQNKDRKIKKWGKIK